MGVSGQPANQRAAQNPPAKGEREFLRRVAAELPVRGGPVGFGHDLASIETSPGGLLWSTDMLADGVDFESARHAWRDIGRKAMAVNLSDCAAGATIPVAALCAVSLHDGLSMDAALELLRGVRDRGAEFGCPLTGGDTNSWAHPTVICVTVAARPDGDRPPVTRCGARPGDRIYLTGRVGGSLLGRHLDPTPRIAAALDINRQLRPHAMIDISDGLAIDLWHICESSGVGAAIDEDSLDSVVHPDAVTLAGKTGQTPREHALHDGEDFELIVVLANDAPAGACRRLRLLPLGEITADRELAIRHADGRCFPLEIRGWEHFRG